MVDDTLDRIVPSQSPIKIQDDQKKKNPKQRKRTEIGYKRLPKVDEKKKEKTKEGTVDITV